LAHEKKLEIVPSKPTVSVVVPITKFAIVELFIRAVVPIDAEPDNVARTIDGIVMYVCRDVNFFSARSCSHEKHKQRSPSSERMRSSCEFQLTGV